MYAEEKKPCKSLLIQIFLSPNRPPAYHHVQPGVWPRHASWRNYRRYWSSIRKFLFVCRAWDHFLKQVRCDDVTIHKQIEDHIEKFEAGLLARDTKKGQVKLSCGVCRNSNRLSSLWYPFQRRGPRKYGGNRMRKKSAGNSGFWPLHSLRNHPN